MDKPKKTLKRIVKPKPDPEPDYYKPYEIEYSITFDMKNWRKVHPPHLAAAMEAGAAAIQASLERVSPTPYHVAGIDAQARYSTVHWYSEDDDE